MRFITKSLGSQTFNQWASRQRLRRTSDWDRIHLPQNRAIKISLKQSLLSEQKNLCCYCGERVGAHGGDNHVEHLVPRVVDLNLIFDYLNLLISCQGDDWQTNRHKLHCGHKKARQILPITPLDPQCETVFSFTLQGKIIPQGADAALSVQVLGLDHAKLDNARIGALSILYSDRTCQAFLPDEDLQALLTKLSNPSAGPMIPYHFVILSVLEWLLHQGTNTNSSGT